jgi:antitoxin (DNA-binding transcriptional repressor) of toxin-antitoxin stability system
MRHITVDDAKTQFDTLVAEVEASGDEIVLTRDGVAVARLVREHAAELPELTPDEVAERRRVVSRIRERAASINLGASPEDIKQWINEGRR